MIRVEGLTKLYQESKGINDISFSVNEGEVFGFLGPNGAGKTTTIRHLMGFIRPQSGRAYINNYDCWSESKKVKEIVGYLPGEINFMEHMTGLDFLNLVAGMHGDHQEYFQRLEELASRFSINPKQPIKKMSKGMKQKIGIIAAFMINPKLLILDEPTSGLDPLMQKVFVDLVLEEKKLGKTIFISSHIFDEVEKTCDHVAIIKQGKLVAVEEINSLKKSQQKLFEIELETEKDMEFICDSDLNVISVKNNSLVIRIQGDINLLFQKLAQVRVINFTVKVTELEDIFMHFYES